MGEAQPVCQRHAGGGGGGEGVPPLSLGGPGGLPQEICKFLKQFGGI